MSRRAPKKSAPSQSAHCGPTASHCHALVRVEGSAIRNKIKKDYDKALRDLDHSRRQLDQFHQTDVPQYTRWLNSHFGALLTELRELSQKIAADEQLIFQVENEAMCGGGSYASAYKRVMDFRENPPPPPPPGEDDGEPDAEREPTGARPESENFDDREDPLRALFEQLFGEFGPEDGAEEFRERMGGFRPQEPKLPPASARLKELYRALVRRLHPDTQQTMTPQKTEWWHQAQAAYEAGDADQLEVILTLCEIDDSGTTRHTSASLLQRITAQLKHSLREIKRQISGRRKDPAWGFSRRTDHEVLLEQTRRTLAGDLLALRHHWLAGQQIITGWKTAAERPRPARPRRKRQAQDMEFPF